ncbi:hypothetical protein Pyn_21450 [Prunus yedoensis var. nudiflora]|uniref:Uncharacterized protein n=1 Tax=Prunus yedoensis var. nudiflora TaxID=2094558 RepID=A0A314YX81_PRUYE|nr:hypothetical protein Pyn_21450 [Prunus yedoensis var. nudiflora]
MDDLTNSENPIKLAFSNLHRPISHHSCNCCRVSCRRVSADTKPTSRDIAARRGGGGWRRTSCACCASAAQPPRVPPCPAASASTASFPISPLASVLSSPGPATAPIAQLLFKA